jgi:DNA-binding beta-propeller fold protein YncE
VAVDIRPGVTIGSIALRDRFRAAPRISEVIEMIMRAKGGRRPDSMLVFSCAVALAPACFASTLYWTDFSRTNAGGVSRVDTQTLIYEPVISSGLTSPYRLAIDQAGGKMYWTTTYTGDVLRANLDGSNVETIIDRSGAQLGIAVDGGGGSIYWSAGAEIYRADLDGSNQTLLVTADTGDIVQDLTIDQDSGKLYFSNYDGVAPGKLQRVNLDGTSLEDVVTGIAYGPAGLAVDSTTGMA